MERLDGKLVSQKILDQLKEQVAAIKAEHEVTPGLAVVIVGEDPASQVYVRMKVKRATELGIYSEKHELPAETSQAELLALVEKLNHNPRIHGILVQSPLPAHIDEPTVIETIHPSKDVDCFHPYNVGKLLIGDTDGFAPCTPQGIMELLNHYDIRTNGQHAVVLGRSNIVGKPMAVLLVRKDDRANCTVTICHSRTRNLNGICRQADILISAIGKPNLVTADMVKDSAVVIDVGMNRVDDPDSAKGYQLVGDVDYDNVASKTSYITPVPGGVGPMTIAILLRNSVQACIRQHKL